MCRCATIAVFMVKMVFPSAGHRVNLWHHHKQFRELILEHTSTPRKRKPLKIFYFLSFTTQMLQRHEVKYPHVREVQGSSKTCWCLTGLCFLLPTVKMQIKLRGQHMLAQFSSETRLSTRQIAPSHTKRNCSTAMHLLQCDVLGI